MPLYDYHCKHCDKDFEAFNKVSTYKTFPCPICKKDSTLIIRKANKDWFPSGGFWHEHLDTDPVFVTSKKHLKEECKKRGLIANCLL